MRQISKLWSHDVIISFISFCTHSTHTLSCISNWANQWRFQILFKIDDWFSSMRKHQRLARNHIDQLVLKWKKSIFRPDYHLISLFACMIIHSHAPCSDSVNILMFSSQAQIGQKPFFLLNLMKKKESDQNHSLLYQIFTNWWIDEGNFTGRHEVVQFYILYIVNLLCQNMLKEKLNTYKKAE